MMEENKESLGNVLPGPTGDEILSRIGNLTPDELLKKSAKSGYLPGIKKALDQGADIHVNHDETLELALVNGHIDTIKLLLDNGADVHIWADYPLRYAVKIERKKLIKLLLNYGAYADHRILERLIINKKHKILKLIKLYSKK